MENEVNLHSFYNQHRFFLSNVLTPSWRASSQAARFEIQRELTITAIALKRYQLRTGKPAPNLEALVPEFLPDLPRDFADGKYLRYHPNSDGTFTLYSVGEDGVDDGGNPNRSPGGNLGFWDGRDWVWPMPASREEVAAYNKQYKY